MIRAMVWGLAFALIAAALFWLVPVNSFNSSQRRSFAVETIVSQTPAKASVQASVARIESANLWGTAQAPADLPKITGKIVGAVRNGDERYVLLQVGKQMALQLKVGDALPPQIEPFGGGTIVDIDAEHISVLKNGETFVISVTNS